MAEAGGEGKAGERRLSNGTMEHLKAIESLQKATLSEAKAPAKKKPKDKNKAPHVPKMDIDKRHKIILFGRIYKGVDADEERLYSFTHQRADGVITEGYIPVGFLSMLPVEDEHLFFAVRKTPMGPEFQVAHKTEKNVVCDWDLNPDAMWGNVVTNFDRRDLFSEKTMNYLDADPFVLFGVDDLITQKALRKLDKFPVLLSRGVKPDSDEWFAYLELDPLADEPLGWIVQSLAEMELPAPWTSYKGVGSIVCFLNHQTGRSTWKHPFYDYFAQLKHFATTASPEHVKQCRLNRLIWSYETQGPTGSLQEPLVSPEYIENLAEIMGYDLAAEPYIVRDLKTYIKIFGHSYRTNEEVAIEDVFALEEAVRLNRSRTDLIQDTWKGLRDLPTKETYKTAKRLYDEENEIIRKLASGEVMCVECDSVALSYCTMFEDYMCLACFARLHQKGHRKDAKAYKLEVCTMCKSKAAKLQCGYTGRLFCLECFAMKHIKALPPHAKEIAPTKIHYQKMAPPKAPTEEEQDEGSSDEESEVDSELGVLGAQWAPFFDAKGIQFYYNFATGERMRRSPRASSGDSEASTPQSKRKEARHGLQMDDALSDSIAEDGLLDALEEDEGVLGQSQKKKNRLVKEPPTLHPRPIKPPYRTNPLSEGHRVSPKRGGGKSVYLSDSPATESARGRGKALSNTEPMSD
ncbi:unnamed protein product [Amoebophrya sp. A25]|nr:unnamed protein product [Amoebophrya sp. A25]|eukprot:GSA25T00014543001.1